MPRDNGVREGLLRADFDTLVRLATDEDAFPVFFSEHHGDESFDGVEAEVTEAAKIVDNLMKAIRVNTYYWKAMSELAAYVFGDMYDGSIPLDPTPAELEVPVLADDEVVASTPDEPATAARDAPEYPWTTGETWLDAVRYLIGRVQLGFDAKQKRACIPAGRGRGATPGKGHKRSRSMMASEHDD